MNDEAKEKLKENLKSGKLPSLALALEMWIGGKYRSDSLGPAELNFMQTISLQRNICCDLDVVAKASKFFIEAWYKDQTLKETLINCHEHPDADMPFFTQHYEAQVKENGETFCFDNSGHIRD